MKAILITADGLEILTDVPGDSLVYQRGCLMPFGKSGPSIYERRYEWIDTLRGAAMEIEVYREKVEK